MTEKFDRAMDLLRRQQYGDVAKTIEDDNRVPVGELEELAADLKKKGDRYAAAELQDIIDNHD